MRHANHWSHFGLSELTRMVSTLARQFCEISRWRQRLHRSESRLADPPSVSLVFAVGCLKGARIAVVPRQHISTIKKVAIRGDLREHWKPTIKGNRRLPSRSLPFSPGPCYSASSRRSKEATLRDVPRKSRKCLISPGASSTTSSATLSGRQ